MRNFILFIVFHLIHANLFSQSDLMLQMLDDIPQANITNPSIFNEKSYYSLPAFTFNYENSAFSYKDLISPRADGTTKLDIENVLNKLSKNNHAFVRLNISLINFGIKYKKMFFTLSATEKLNGQLFYSKDLIHLAWNGNARYVGQTINIAPQINANYYRELALGFSYAHTDKVTFGIKPKLLFGLANVSSYQNSITLHTDTNIYELNVETNINIQTSGIDNFTEDALRAAFTTKNMGFATDLGVFFKPHQKWEAQLSILNLGFIHWKNDVNNLKAKGNFQFDGININNLFQNGTFSLEELTDSLKNTFKISESTNSFSSMLTPSIYGSFNYKIHNRFKMYFIYHHAIFKKSLPSFGLGVKYAAPKFFTASLISIKHKNYLNLGLATTFKVKWFQLFLATDNIISTFNWKSHRNVNFRFGVNFLFSKKNKLD